METQGVIRLCDVRSASEGPARVDWAGVHRGNKREQEGTRGKGEGHAAQIAQARRERVRGGDGDRDRVGAGTEARSHRNTATATAGGSRLALVRRGGAPRV